MAKRRRLEVPTAPVSGLEVKSPGRRAAPPVARVAGDAAALAAADEALAAIEAAKGEGRLAIRLPLDAIAVDHLVRDRMGGRDEDMEALIASIRVHGQRTPIEVVETGAGGFGLISGWRRLSALKALRAESDEARFAHVLAVIRTPADAGAAYVAMVEENEIRVGLSYFERARIAHLAAERGAFASPEAAIDALFASGSRARRSKIRSFLRILEEIGDHLRFPAHLPERLGLRVAAALKEGGKPALLEALAKPAEDAAAEAAALQVALTPKPPARPRPAAARGDEVAPGLTLTTRGAGAKARLTVAGPGVTPDLIARIRAILVASKGDAK